MESEREQMRGQKREGEGPHCYLPRREAYLPVVFFLFFLKKRHFSQQLFGSRQAVVTGKYIRPDLVCFGLFWRCCNYERQGGWWSGRVTLILFSFSACAHFLLLFGPFFLPVSLSSLLPPFILHAAVLLDSNLDLCFVFLLWMKWNRNKCATWMLNRMAGFYFEGISFNITLVFF